MESVTLDKTTLTLEPGETAKLTATVKPDNADDKTVTWSSSDEKVATVSNDGTVMAHAEGTATITAKAGSKETICGVTVKLALVPVESVTLNETTITLTRGETRKLTATVTPGNADDKTVAWSSSNADIATVDKDGTVTAVSKGTATVTAKAGGKEATCEITVSVAVERVTLNAETLTVEPGKTRTLTATVMPSNADDKTVTWQSSNSAVVTVDKDGTVTAVAEGTATVTAQAGGKTAECTVTVRRILIAVNNVTLNTTTLTLTRGETGKLAATVTPDNADDKTVAWSSSNDEVATVDKDGTVTAIKAGNATITAQAGDITAECAVTVNPILVASVALDKNTLTLMRGETGTLTATVTPDNADDKTVAWSSDDETVATVGNDGTVTAVKAGNATITAQSGDIKATCAVTVNPILVENVTLNKNTLTLDLDETEKLTATVTPSNADDTTVAWSSDDETVATVGNDGTVKVVSKGKATITARAGGKESTCEVTVKVSVKNVALNADTLTLAPNMTRTLSATVTPDTADDKTVTWSSDDEKVVTVGADGTVTAVSKGTATITATTQDGGKTAECAVTVKQAVESVSLDKNTLTLGPNMTYKLTATVKPDDADDKTVTWSSDDEKVATVGTDGTITAVKRGTATVTARAGNKTAVCAVTVHTNHSYSNDKCKECGFPKPTMEGGSIDDYGWLRKYSGSEANVVIPEGVTAIANDVFYNNKVLNSVTIPDSVTYIIDGDVTEEKGAFTSCTNLRSVTIGDGVTIIGSCAFNWCQNLTSVTSIGESTFEDCTSLTGVTIPDSVTSIGNYTFDGCTSLTSVTIPDGVTSIGKSTFEYCTSLTDVTIPDGVTNIGDGAFSGCDGLTSMTIPDSVTSIGEKVFYYCANLTDVTIGNGIQTVGKDAFGGLWSHLEKVTYKGTLAQWCGIDWENDANPLSSNWKVILYIGGEELTVADIPNGETSIKPNAFGRCHNLETVTIGKGVESIGGLSFGYCDKLTTVYYTGTKEEWKKITISGSGLSGKTIVCTDGELTAE